MTTSMPSTSRPRAATSVATSRPCGLGPEPVEGPLAGALGEPSVEDAGPDAVAGELLGQPVGAVLGAHEHERAADARGDDGGHLHLVELVDLEEAVLHLLDGGLGRVDLVLDRVADPVTDQAGDVVVQRGREEHGLVLARDAAQEPDDLGQEAHVDHAVGLVEHEHLHVLERDVAAADQVDQAAGGGHDHVVAAVGGLDLAVHGRAAVDGGDGAVDGLGQRRQHVADLHGQLARGHEHQGGGPARLGLGRALEEGKAEGEGLARAGLGLAADVAAGEGVADGELLDRERGGDAERVED